MSRYTLVSILMALIILISASNIFILYKIKNNTINLINCIIQNFDNDNIEVVNQKKITLFEKWENDKKYLSIFIRHNILDEISFQIAILSSIENEAFKGQLCAIKVLIIDIFEDELPLLRNIL